MAVTRPQTQPGVVERWAQDLADAVELRAKRTAAKRRSPAPSTAASPAGSTDEADAFIKSIMADDDGPPDAVPPA